MTTTKKIKATQIGYNSMTGLTMRHVTFHDFENKVFTEGRERTKRQMKSFDNTILIEGHLDIKKLDDDRFRKTEDGCKQRMFPPAKEDLELDLKVLESLDGMTKLVDNDLKAIFLKEIEKESN